MMCLSLEKNELAFMSFRLVAVTSTSSEIQSVSFHLIGTY